MATIKDISRVTGLSVGTISKYLNNKPVLPENSAMIQQAIESLHYQVNARIEDQPNADSRLFDASLGVAFFSAHYLNRGRTPARARLQCHGLCI